MADRVGAGGQKVGIGLEQIFLCFPEHRTEIERLLESDPDFQEMCEDYVEVATYLSDCSRQAESSARATQDYRALLESLQAEIAAALHEMR